MPKREKVKGINMADAKTKKGFNPLRFFREVRMEGRKITWPSRQETTVSTIAVFIMVVIASTFLYFADQILAWAVRLIMGF
jgi:preprotein translocase subunit SecE